MTAWKLLEQHFCDRWSAAHEGHPPSMERLLRWAEQSRSITPDMEDFLQACRRVRNAYAHVVFPGYAGPVMTPPPEVVVRLERINEALRSPTLLKRAAPLADVCRPTTSLREALQDMCDRDFTQLPYQHPERGWELITRDQIARWVEAQAGSGGHVLVDLDMPVRSLSDDSRIGPAVPYLMDSSATVSDAVRVLDAALLALHSASQRYPVVLMLPGYNESCKIITAFDLPGLNALLGR